MVPDPRTPAGFAFLLVLLVMVHPVQGQHLPEGAEDWYLFTDDGHRVYVVELGPSAPAPDTIVVLHGGWGAEHSYLWPAVQPLADRYHFILYDQRGSLRSPPADSTLSVDRLVADLEELRRELGGERLTILGHSMGTRLATAYLSRHPERVRGLVLVSPPLALPEDGGPVDTAEVRRAQERFGEFHREQTGRQMAAEGFDAERDPATSRESTHRWRIAFTAANAFHVERWRKMQGGMSFYNSEVARHVNENTPEPLLDQAHHHRTLREAEVPVRIILGDHDFVDFGLVAWPKAVEEMPNVELETLEDAGHNVWIDRPDAFRALLLQALEEVRE